MTRYYNVWAGNPKGVSENVTQCVVAVYRAPSGRRQCTRKRGHGPENEYCKQHAAIRENGQYLVVPEHRKAEGK